MPLRDEEGGGRRGEDGGDGEGGAGVEGACAMYISRYTAQRKALEKEMEGGREAEGLVYWG